MLAAILKLFPFMWPFFKEMLLGGRNHPIFTNRKSSGWVKIIISLLISSLAAIGDAYWTQVKENEKLQTELTQLKTSSSSEQIRFNENHFKLMICERELKFSKDDIKLIQEKLDSKCPEITPAVNKILEPRNTPQVPMIPPSVKETLKQRAQRKLDELRKKEQ